MANSVMKHYVQAFRAAAIVGAVALGTFTAAQAQSSSNGVINGRLLQELLAHPDSLTGTATFPVVFCWYKGQPALYIRTDASDPGAAADQGVNLVPRLANAIDAPNGAVDDIYQVTNFTQGNVVPSAPVPAGPTNTDPNYTPLWQVTLVTWNQGVTPHTLKSEEDILAARDAGLVSLNKTNIVVNCPIIFTPLGGQLPTVKIHLKEKEDSH